MKHIVSPLLSNQNDIIPTTEQQRKYWVYLDITTSNSFAYTINPKDGIFSFLTNDWWYKAVGQRTSGIRNDNGDGYYIRHINSTTFPTNITNIVGGIILRSVIYKNDIFKFDPVLVDSIGQNGEYGVKYGGIYWSYNYGSRFVSISRGWLGFKNINHYNYLIGGLNRVDPNWRDKLHPWYFDLKDSNRCINKVLPLYISIFRDDTGNWPWAGHILGFSNNKLDINKDGNGILYPGEASGLLAVFTRQWSRTVNWNYNTIANGQEGLDIFILIYNSICK